MAKVTKQQASDFVLGSVELKRLGVFERAGIDTRPLTAAERDAQKLVCDLTFWSRRAKNPAHRPQKIDTPLLRDKIVQAVLFERYTSPKKQMKRIVGEVGGYYEVSDGYVFRCLREVAPQRRRQIAEAVIVSCYWPETMARLQILAATKMT